MKLICRQQPGAVQLSAKIKQRWTKLLTDALAYVSVDGKVRLFAVEVFITLDKNPSYIKFLQIYITSIWVIIVIFLSGILL